MTLTANEKESALQRQVHIRNLVDQFINSELWNEYMEPKLRSRLESLADRTYWRPGMSASIDETAMLSAYNGGQAAVINEFLQDFNIWGQQGDIAEEKLNKMIQEKK